ncbi:MAG TPA: hypothetical protein VMS79_00580 [Methanomassiliicoccales archaeon]|nr:hypothetical protein [Methanomassiliicoccales archaeon]
MRRQGIDEFFPERFAVKLERAKTIPDIFEVVKDGVEAAERVSRSGLMLGLAELGGSRDSTIGGLHPIGTNIILLNKVPLRRVEESYPELYKPYVFHVLLHEYLHTIGLVDEEGVRRKTYDITLYLFGEEHLATKLAKDIKAFLPFITYPGRIPLPEGTQIELVEGFDRSSSEDYIA